MQTSTVEPIDIRRDSPAASLRQAARLLEIAHADALEAFATASDRERLDLVVAIGETSLAQHAMTTRYARVLDSRPGSATAKSCGYRSAAELLQHEHGLRKFEADAYVRLARLIEGREYPELATLVNAGEVSAQQAAVIVRYLDEKSVSCEPELVQRMDAAATEFALGADTHAPLTPEQLKRLMRAWFAEEDPESVALTAEQQYEARECSYVQLDDGMVKFIALLPPELATIVMQFLDAHAAPRVCFVDEDEARDATVDTRLRKQKSADAFVMAFSVTAKTKHASTQGGAAPTLLITAKASELDKHAAGLPGVASLDRTGDLVPASVAARITCDGAVQAAITDDNGNVLRLGRSQRLFSPAQRRAITAKYRTCQAPTCDIPGVWSEIHHVRSWQDGGGTDVDNGIPLCNFHHHEVHRDHLRIERDPVTREYRVVSRLRR